jgi:hypothetical protein
MLGDDLYQLADGCQEQQHFHLEKGRILGLRLSGRTQNCIDSAGTVLAVLLYANET